MCWFRAGVTKSHGEPRVNDGLGFLPYSNSVHWRDEPERGPAFREAVTLGELPPGYGVDDGAAVLFAGTDPVEAVRTSRSGGVWFVGEDGGANPLDCVELTPPAIDSAPLLSIEEYREHRRSADRAARAR
jgi:hypothetical protein